VLTPSILGHLRWQNRTLLFLGLVFLLFALLAIPCWGMAFHDGEDGVGFAALGAGVGSGVAAFLLLDTYLREGRRFLRHPDVLALARYGQPEEVIAAIDRELSAADTVRIGDTYVTASWLVILPQGMNWIRCLRLDSIVQADLEPRGPALHEMGAELVAEFVDRDGVKVRRPGTKKAVRRVFIEVLARTPWALGRFEEQTEMNWGEEREQVLREVDARREQIR
jgi:hypothetical protein